MVLKYYTKEKALKKLSEVLPGHELEALEAVTCAFHGIIFQFAFMGVMYYFTYNTLRNRFEVSDARPKY